MSDQITATGSESKFQAHEAGQFVGQCVDLIDLGFDVSDFPGEDRYLKQMCVLVFRTGERNESTGEYIDVAREFTVSMGDKSNLRKFLEQWRGRPYTKEQITEGVPLHKLTGQFGLLTVAHRVSGKGRTYANITACVGIPKQMTGSVRPFTDYVRDPYWATKKAEYASRAAAFTGAASRVAPSSSSAEQEPDFSDVPFPDEEPLPF